MVVLKCIIFYGAYCIFPFMIFLIWVFIKRKQFFTRTILAMAFFASLIFVYSRFIEPKILVVHFDKICLEDSCNGESLKIAVVADLHYGIYNNGVSLDRIVEKINEAEVDLVLMPGDFTYHLPEEDMIETFAPLENIEAPVYAVTGNHDVGIRRGVSGEVVKPFSAEILREALRGHGVIVIDNSVKEIEIKGIDLKIVGLSDLWEGNTDFSLVEGFSNDENVIVLAHNPDSVYYFTEGTDVDFVVSGHTHGGQIRIPFLYKYVIPTEYDFDKGLYDINGIKVYVTPGIGMVGFPMRFLMPPQIDILDTIFE